ADQIRKDADLVARETVMTAREAFEKECQSRRQTLESLETRIAQREENLDRRVSLLDRKEEKLDEGLAKIETDQAALEARGLETDRAQEAVRMKLQEVAALTREEARRIVIERIEEETRADSVQLIRKIQETARRDAEAKAREIITTAIERFASDQVSHVTTCTVSIPSDDMKGRIIGKEGRNIRALENETGCNILIDDTPGVVVVSGFDPYRREIARRTVEKLVADGRIQPARIEDIVAEVRSELDSIIARAGEDALSELRLTGAAPDLVRTLGRLKFRHSFSQNVLQHSVEMGHLMGMMASDLGLDPAIARRVGLFHDIGKALDHSIEGGHALIGADLLKRCGESAVVVHAVAAHHHDVHTDSAYAALASAADAITAARPGARSETTAAYLKRLEQLEIIARSFRGVKQSYAIQAGRELRVFVMPERVEDHELLHMARSLARQIEEQVGYSGQIKVTVIRESRCVEYAK
ncbi:MAG: ribonuclease Y, partial [Kiritimatiellia bacterium]|nr:ribonuclease Y [Kiritimatiellia bacterium]